MYILNFRSCFFNLAEVFTVEVPRVQPHPPQEPSHERLRRPPARYRNGSSSKSSTSGSQKGNHVGIMILQRHDFDTYFITKCCLENQGHALILLVCLLAKFNHACDK